MSKHPPGAIIFAGGEFLRFSGFMFSLLDTKKPEGTRVLMKQSVSIVDNLNHCIRNMGDEMEWVHVQADDHIWEPDMLLRLLDHEVDVVVPLILMRSPPFQPVIYKERSELGYRPFALDELPEEGLIEVHAAGSAGLTVRRHVLEAVGDPWFSYRDGQYLNEDLVLCQKIREAGFTIWCDVAARMGHRATYTVWPVHDDHGWGIGMNMGSSKEDGTPQSLTIRPRERQEV